MAFLPSAQHHDCTCGPDPIPCPLLPFPSALGCTALHSCPGKEDIPSREHFLSRGGSCSMCRADSAGHVRSSSAENPHVSSKILSSRRFLLFRVEACSQLQIFRRCGARIAADRVETDGNLSSGRGARVAFPHPDTCSAWCSAGLKHWVGHRSGCCYFKSWSGFLFLSAQAEEVQVLRSQGQSCCQWQPEKHSTLSSQTGQVLQKRATEPW